MSNRQKANKFMLGFCGKPTVPGKYVPSKNDLLKILDTLRFKDPPEVNNARGALDEATEARRAFLRSNETWRRLRRAEREADCELKRIECSERERWKDETAECRTMLRLHGVTPELIQRIERLVHGEE